MQLIYWMRKTPMSSSGRASTLICPRHLMLTLRIRAKRNWVKILPRMLKKKREIVKITKHKLQNVLSLVATK